MLNQSSQRGRGMIGWILVIGVVGLFFKVGFTLAPIYANHFKITAALKKVGENPGSSVLGAGELRGALQKYWDIENVDHIGTADIKVKKTATGRAFAFDYEVRAPLAAEISFIVHFVGEQPLPGGDAP